VLEAEEAVETEIELDVAVGSREGVRENFGTEEVACGRRREGEAEGFVEGVNVSLETEEVESEGRSPGEENVLRDEEATALLRSAAIDDTFRASDQSGWATII